MRRVALFLAVALSFAACARGEDKKSAATPTTITTSTSSTTTSTAVAETTTTLAGCGVIPKRNVTRSDLTQYDIDATVDLDKNEVRGTLRAEFTPDLATDRIVMRLWPNGPIPAGHGGHMTVSAASVDGRDVPISLANATTAVANTGQLAAKEAIGFAVAFTVTLPTNLDDRLSRVGSTVRLGSWMPLLAWEPGVGWALDPPTTSNAEASLSVHADFIVRLKVPDGFTVLGGGVQTGTNEWVAAGAPDWAASIGHFNLLEGKAGSVPVIVGVDTSLNESPNTYLTRVVAALQKLAARYGEYPWPTYTLAITPTLKGGIEYPGHVMQGPRTLTRTLPHEIAHQYFYGLVGSDQGRDPWIDEGLASWAEAQVDGTYAAFRAKSIPAGGKNHVGEPMTFWDKQHGAYYRSVYVQTVQALAALGVSASQIDCALARFVATNAYRVATPNDVLAALETVAPNARAVLERYGVRFAA